MGYCGYPKSGAGVAHALSSDWSGQSGIPSQTEYRGMHWPDLHAQLSSLHAIMIRDFRTEHTV